MRTLVVLAVGDAETGRMNRFYKLFDGFDRELERGRTWFYPSACEHNGMLHVGVTLQETNNVRSVALASMPIANL